MTPQFHHYITETLAKYKQFFLLEKNRFSLLEDQLARQENICTRKNFRGHLTASAYIVHLGSKRIFLIRNINLKKWLAPGGHFDENDTTMQETAYREAIEESGLQGLLLAPWHQKNSIPLDIDTHYIPANPKKQEEDHYHHDFRYVFFFAGNKDDVMLQQQEVSAGEWVKMDMLFSDFSGRNVIEKIGEFIV